MNLSKAMREPRRARVIYKHSGECWYYIQPRSIELFVSLEKGKAASSSIRLTRKQLEKALEIMDARNRD